MVRVSREYFNKLIAKKKANPNTRVTYKKKSTSSGSSSGSSNNQNKQNTILSKQEFLKQNNLTDTGANTRDYNNYLAKIDPKNTSSYKVINKTESGGEKIKTVYNDGSSITTSTDKFGNPISTSSSTRKDTQKKFINQLEQHQKNKTEIKKDFFSPEKVNQVSTDTSKQLQKFKSGYTDSVAKKSYFTSGDPFQYSRAKSYYSKQLADNSINNNSKNNINDINNIDNKKNNFILTSKDSASLTDYQSKYGSKVPGNIIDENLSKTKKSLLPSLKQVKEMIPFTLSSARESDYSNTDWKWNPLSVGLYVSTKGLYSKENFQNIRKIKGKFEELEIKGIRNNNNVIKGIGAIGSTTLSPFATQKKTERLIMTAGIGAGIGAVSSINPVLGGVVLAGGTGYLASQVPNIQSKYYSLGSDPIGYRETLAFDGANLASGIGGSYLGNKLGISVKSSYKSYKTNKMSKWQNKIKKYEWGKEFVTDRKLNFWEKQLIDNKLISRSQKEYLIRRADGKINYGIPTQKGIQTQLKPSDIDINNRYFENQKPIELSRYSKGYNDYIGKYSQIPKNVRIVNTVETLGSLKVKPSRQLKINQKYINLYKQQKIEIVKPDFFKKIKNFIPSKKGTSTITSQIKILEDSIYSQKNQLLDNTIITKFEPSTNIKSTNNLKYFPIITNTKQDINILTLTDGKIKYSTKQLQAYKLRTKVKTLESYKVRTEALKDTEDYVFKIKSKSKSKSKSRPRAKIREREMVKPPIYYPKQENKEQEIIKKKPTEDKQKPTEDKQKPTEDKFSFGYGFFNLKFNSKKNKQQNNQGFSVFIKSRGNFTKINNKFSLSKLGALSLGSKITDETSSATFIVKPSSLPFRKSNNGNSFLKNSNKFNISKFGNTIKGVEKNKYRISTIGEKQGITYKGIYSKKKKKKKTKFKYF